MVFENTSFEHLVKASLIYTPGIKSFFKAVQRTFLSFESFLEQMAKYDFKQKKPLLLLSKQISPVR